MCSEEFRKRWPRTVTRSSQCSLRTFYNNDLLLGKRASEEVVRASWKVTAGASAMASLACVPTWREDFRQDLARVDVPTLVIHGDEDRIVPRAAAGQRSAKIAKGSHPLVVNGGPHCIACTLQRNSMPPFWALMTKLCKSSTK
jgi:pimeloyl-ACP methyl ester carboxylesterase